MAAFAAASRQIPPHARRKSDTIVKAGVPGYWKAHDLDVSYVAGDHQRIIRAPQAPTGADLEMAGGGGHAQRCSGLVRARSGA